VSESVGFEIFKIANRFRPCLFCLAAKPRSYQLSVARSKGNAQDFDILLMVEYKNMAAFDSLREKADPIADKILGSEDVQRQGAIKRIEIREIMGNKLMREVTLK
jgi:hypothetical protein